MGALITIATLLVLGVVAVDLARRLPVGASLVWVDEFVVLGHAAPNLWWLLTVFYRYWGFDVYYYPEPYWGPMVGYTRKIGIWLGGIHFMLYLGRTGRTGDECTMRAVPSRKWYEVDF